MQQVQAYTTKESTLSLINKILAISSFFFGYSFIWTAITATILPSLKKIQNLLFTVQISEIVGDDKKEYYLSFVGLLGGSSMLATPTFGALSDKTNFGFGKRRTYIVVGVTISAIFFMLLSFFTTSSMINIVILMILFLFCRISTSIAFGPYGGLLSDLIPTEKQGIATGIQTFGFFAGNLLGTISSGYALAILGFILPTFYTVLGIKEDSNPQNHSNQQPESENPSEFSWKQWFYDNVFKSFYFPFETYNTFYAVSFCTLFMYLGFYLIGPYFQYFLKDILDYRMPVISSAIGLTIFMTCAAIGSIIGGYFSDKIGPKIISYMGIFSLMFGFGGYLFVVLFATESDFAGVFLIVSFIFIGFGFGASLSSLNVMGHHCMPSKDKMGRDFSVIHQCMALGQIFGTLIGGQILGWIKLFSLKLAYILLLLTTILCFMVVMVILFFLKIEYIGEWREKKDQQSNIHHVDESEINNFSLLDEEEIVEEI